MGDISKINDVHWSVGQEGAEIIRALATQVILLFRVLYLRN